MKSISFSSDIITIDNHITSYADDDGDENENKDDYRLWYTNEELEDFLKKEYEEISTEAFYTIISSIIVVLEEQKRQRKRREGIMKVKQQQQLDDNVQIAEAYSNLTQKPTKEAYLKGKLHQKDATSSYLANPSILLSPNIQDKKIIKIMIHDVALYSSSV